MGDVVGHLRARLADSTAAEHVIAFLGQWWMVIVGVLALAVLWPRSSS